MTNQKRSEVWLTHQHKVRQALTHAVECAPGVVETAVEESVLGLLSAQAHPVWEARFDGWIGPVLDERSLSAMTELALPPKGARRVEVKARRKGGGDNRIRLNVCDCDILALVEWWAEGQGEEAKIRGDLYVFQDIRNDFGARQDGVAGFGIAQMVARKALLDGAEAPTLLSARQPH